MDPNAPNLTRSPCCPQNLALWSVVSTEEYVERNTRILIALQKKYTPQEVFYSVQELMDEFESKDFIGPMRERFSAAFDALDDDAPFLEGRSPVATDKKASTSSHDVPSPSFMDRVHKWEESTSDASQLAILRARGWTPSTQAKRKREASLEIAGRASGSEASTADAANSEVART